jgi:hypothetical protein
MTHALKPARAKVDDAAIDRERAPVVVATAAHRERDVVVACLFGREPAEEDFDVERLPVDDEGAAARSGRLVGGFGRALAIFAARGISVGRCRIRQRAAVIVVTAACGREHDQRGQTRQYGQGSHHGPSDPCSSLRS